MVDVAQEGDRGGGLTKSVSDGFEALYRAEYPGMVRLAFVLTGSGDAAEDVVQDAFALLHAKLGRVDNPGGYLRVTVVNLCRNQQRRRRQDRRLSSRLARLPLSSLDASEMADVLLHLPYRQRAVLVLRYWGDWSEAEIATALGCRPGTVKALASRGLDRLRREITK
jgi:RNA polymerase sigma-70 factor (sigma-E family)